jgi:hypothetical protein
MSNIPSNAISENVPTGSDIPITADQLDGKVMASDHSDSLAVTLTTNKRASELISSDSAVAQGNQMALILSDDQHSEGRRVAIDSGILQDALGYEPQAIYGTHESGEQWTAKGTYVDGYLIFDVPHFSTNTVTFSGQVTVNAKASNDTKINYQLRQDSIVSKPSLTFTGSLNQRWNNQTHNIQVGNGKKFDIDGSIDPSGPINSNPVVELSDAGVTESKSKSAWSGRGVYYWTTPDEKITSHSLSVNGAGEYELTKIFNDETGELLSETGANSFTSSSDNGGSLPRNTQLRIETGQQESGADGHDSVTLSWTEVYPLQNPSVDFNTTDGTDIQINQNMGPADTVTREVDIPLGTSKATLTADNAGSLDVTVKSQEQTQTVNPQITIASASGTQTVAYDGVISNDNTVDVSGQIDPSLISGATSLTVNTDDPANGPVSTVNIDYSHLAQTDITTVYSSSYFKENYNITHTYADATDDVKVTIPFDDNSVVGINTLQYRIDNSQWKSVSESNRRFENTTATAYISPTGGVSAGSTVEVRATGRKINVENGKVKITDPTKPGKPLDTQLEIQSRSEGFSVDVGPTSDGRRVHYAYSIRYETKDYVVISADGSQKLYLPESESGDTFRIKHLKTKVNALNGDVRLGVKEPGSEPKLKVAPGPGGSGDDVEITYYNTQSGVEYLLNSITRSIVIDSDTAQSPVVFEDDDSKEIWAILRDSAPSSGSSSGSVIAGAGQFAQKQASGISGALGSISLPIPDSIPQPILLLIVGIGGFVVVVRRLGIFGGGSSSASGSADDQPSGSGGSLIQLPSGIIASLQRAISGASSGLLRGLRGLLSYIGDILSIVLSNRRATIVGSIALAIGAAQSGLLSLPDGTGILLVVAGIPVASWLILRSRGAVSQRVWLASTLAAVILGLEFVASGTIQTAIEQLTSENVAPLLILAGAGALYLWYRQRQTESNTPDTVNRLIFNGDDD